MRNVIKRYSQLLLIVGFSVVTVFALLRLGDIDISMETLQRVDWTWYSLVFFFFYLSVAARGLRWWRILNMMGYPVSKGYAITLLTAGLFGSMVLPARAGDVGRVVMLKQDHAVPFARGIASITTERALDVFAILSMAVIGGIIALQNRMPVEALQLMGLTAVLFGVGLVGLLGSPRIEHWLRENRFLQTHLPDKLWTLYSRLLEFGFALVHGVRELGQNPLILLIALSESFLIWLYDALIVHGVLWTIGIELWFSQSLFTAMVSDLSIAVPLTPGGLGQFEAVLISLLALFGVSVSDASLTALLLRFAILWSFIPISGLVTYLFGFSRVLNRPAVSEPKSV